MFWLKRYGIPTTDNSKLYTSYHHHGELILKNIIYEVIFKFFAF